MGTNSKIQWTDHTFNPWLGCTKVRMASESGPKRRPFDCDWARDLRDQCVSPGVPFFMKQVDKVRPAPNDLQVTELPVVMA